MISALGRRALRRAPPRLLPSQNAGREETSRSRQVVLNAQRHMCRGMGLSNFVVEGSQAGESQTGSLQALAHAAGELHAQEHLQQVASVVPRGSARPRHAAAPLPGVCEDPLASCHSIHALGHTPGQGKPRVGQLGHPL